jgi:hypothetical protein
MGFVRDTAAQNGKVARADIATKYGVSTQTASADISNYRALFPGMLVYDKSQKIYVVGPEVIAAARALYATETDNHPTIHCNRFPSWAELSNDRKAPYLRRVLQPESRGSELEDETVRQWVEDNGVAVRAILEGRAAVVPIWKGDMGTYLGKRTSWELKVGNCDIEEIRLDQSTRDPGGNNG